MWHAPPINIDIDIVPIGASKHDDVLGQILDNDCVNISAITPIQTLGGFHLMIEFAKIDKEYENSWYNNFKKLKSDDFNVMMNSDNMTPIPGCVQSTYIPKLLKI